VQQIQKSNYPFPYEHMFVILVAVKLRNTSELFPTTKNMRPPADL
jgi:hypothetical protein